MLHLRFFALIAFTSSMLFGCKVGPDFHSPDAPCTNRYTALPLPCNTVCARSPGGESQHLLFDEDIPGEWWELFHSPDLNALICRAISNSPTMAAAQAALRQAQQNLRAEIGFGLFPQITGTAFYERERFPGASLGIPASTTFNLYYVNVGGTYTLDAFGGIRRQIEALGAQVEYQGFELEATYLTLTANVVITAITEASLIEQIEATHELIEIQDNLLAIIQKQFQLGGVPQTNVLQQITQLSQLRATLPPLEKSLAQSRHALAVLVGELPSESCLPDFNLDNIHLPIELPVTCPSTLVRQRPDVRASEALLHAASAQIGVATANLFPQFVISGNFGWEANKISQLFTHNTQAWDYMIQMTQPIFNGGALVAQRRAAIAAFDQAAANYHQTVLIAFQNVADTLRALEEDARTLKADADAEQSSLRTLKIAEQQYKLGGVSFLNLLIAEQQYQQSRLNRIRAQAQRYADTAALFQSLGGGWWNRDFCIASAPQKMDLIDWL